MYYVVHILLQLTFSTQHFAIEIFSWQCNQNNLIKKVVPQYRAIDFPILFNYPAIEKHLVVSSLLYASLCTRVRISLAEKWNCWFTRVYAFNILIATAELSSKKIWSTPLPPHIFFYTLPHIILLSSFLIFYMVIDYWFFFCELFRDVAYFSNYLFLINLKEILICLDINSLSYHLQVFFPSLVVS